MLKQQQLVEKEPRHRIWFKFEKEFKEAYRKTKKAMIKQQMLYFDAEDYFIRASIAVFPFIEEFGKVNTEHAFREAYRFVENPKLKYHHTPWEIETFLVDIMYKRLK